MENDVVKSVMNLSVKYDKNGGKINGVMDGFDVEQWTVDLYDHTQLWIKWIKTTIRKTSW